MRDIPNSALILGLAGLVPFFWGVATSYDPVLHNLSLTWLSERYTGSSVNLIYGTIILAFMSGVLWGFSANVRDKSCLLYTSPSPRDVEESRMPSSA